MTYLSPDRESDDPARRRTDDYPAWLDNLPDDVALAASAMRSRSRSGRGWWAPLQFRAAALRPQRLNCEIRSPNANGYRHSAMVRHHPMEPSDG